MKIKTHEGEETLLATVKSAFPDASVTSVRSWIKLGRLEVNGYRVTKPSFLVKKQDTVTFLSKPNPKSGPIEILFEDEHLVVINKPFGILSVDLDSEKGSGTTNSAHGWMKERYTGEKIYVIHRLDRETSGVMLFARTEEAAVVLKEALKKREVTRVYRAVLQGVLQGEGFWEDFLLENQKTFHVRISTSEEDEGREWAKTYWKSLATSNAYSLVECRLETGKKNQIRVQSSARGYPVAGDEKYGATYSMDDVFTSRICLHARELQFLHPITHKKMRFVVEEPLFFQRLATTY